MTAVSFTGVVNTEGQFKTVASEASLTLTSGKSYTIQIQNIGYLKVADAEFCLKNQIFTWTQASDDLYIKTDSDVILTILENS